MRVRDAVSSLLRIAGTGLRLAADQRVARRSGLPLAVSDLSTAWIEGSLGRCFPGVRLDGFELLEEHSGTTTRARIALAYASRGESRPAPPDTVFLKLTPPQLAHRIFLAATGIGRGEVRFYASLGTEVPVRVPRCYAVQSVGDGRYFALLLEDLGVAGTRFSEVGDRVDVEDARRVVDALASLHAGYWESPRFAKELAWVPSYETRQAQMAWERFVTGQMIAVARRRYGGDFGAGFEAAATLCSEERDLLERLWARGDRTLVHGDCHVGNLFFEAEGVGFLDWQVCGRAPGIRDVSYFLCNSFPSELRARYEGELIERYLAALRDRAVAAPGFEEAWSQHRLFALYTWIAAAFTAAAGGALQAPEIGLAGLRRAMRAVEDLESVDHARACDAGRST